MKVSSIVKVLGGEKVVRRRIHNRMDLIELGAEGVTKDALLHLAEYFGLSVNEIAQLLPVADRTLRRYTPKKHFNRVLSEQILQLAQVAARGSEVFKDKDDFLTWLNQPNIALANKTPKSLLCSRFGTDMVLDVLGRIEYGVFS
jgi:putative toxin-antitoxin system antitoxin component (TIGR02293 family)